MSPKSAQRFWEDDMHQNEDLKRVARIRFDVTRFKICMEWSWNELLSDSRAAGR